MITTYPRKGTVPASPLPWIAAADYNLSPQGDGNFFFIRFSIIVPPFQLIPARGRKPLRSGGNVGFCNISTYPRKGTETRTPWHHFAALAISTYPRKGAKNSASKKMRSFSFANLNSLFSVGYSSMNRAAAAFSLPWLLYCDKMCYNRANSKHLLQNTQTHFLFIVQFFHNL